MNKLPQTVQVLIEHFAKLPGIGPKSASRLVMYLLHSKKEWLSEFATALQDLKSAVKFCQICHNLCDEDVCGICQDTKRDDNTILVVEDVLDLLAFEAIGDYQGKYHILGGVISPMQGIGPEELNITDLVKRVSRLKKTAEIIIATNPNLEGEATAMYLKNELSHIFNLKITRIAKGVPSGADLDYADRTTLIGALSGRVVL